MKSTRGGSFAEHSVGDDMASDPAASTITAPRAALPRVKAVVQTVHGDPAAGAVRWRKKAFDVASTLATSFLLVAITVVQAKLLADALGPAGRGEFAAAVSYTRLLTYIGLLGTNYVITRHVARSGLATASISRSAVRMGGLTGMCAMLVVIGLSLVAFPADKQPLAWLSIVCAMTLPLEHVRLNLNAVDQGSGRMGRFNAGRIVAAAALPILLVFAWLTTSISVRLAVVLLIPATLLGLVFRLVWSDDYHLWRAGSPPVRTLLREGRPYALSVVVTEVFNNLDVLLMLWLASFTQQGLYAAALPAVRLLCVAPEALAVFAFNAGAKQTRPLGVGRLMVLATGTLLVQVLAAVAYWTVLGFLIILVYRQPFADAIVFANLLLPAMVFQGGTIIADGYMRGQGQSKVGVMARLVGALSMLVAAFVFYAPYHALAVPLAASVGSGIAALWLFAAMIRQSLAQQRSPAAMADSL